MEVFTAVNFNSIEVLRDIDGWICAYVSEQSDTFFFLGRSITFHQPTLHYIPLEFNPYPTAFPYGNGMVLHFYQQQESSTTKTVHKVINRGLKAYV